MLTWLRDVRDRFAGSQAAGPDGPRGPRTPRTRVRLPAVTTIPGDVLRTLREFHCDLDAYVLPDGRVWLLKWEEDKGRIHEGRKMLWQARQEGVFSGLETAHLMADGWSLLGELSFHEGCSAGAMLEHAQMTLYATPKQIEEDHARRRRIADGTVRRELAIQRVRDRLYATAGADHGFIYHGRRSFGYNTAQFHPFPVRRQA